MSCLLVEWRIREGNKAADYVDNNDISLAEQSPGKIKKRREKVIWISIYMIIHDYL